MTTTKTKTELGRELERAKADQSFWNEFGLPLGLKLIGWSYRNSATFTPDDPREPGWAPLEVDVNGPLYRLLLKLRAKINNKANADLSRIG